MAPIKIEITYDGKEIDDEFINEWNIHDLTNYYSNKNIINFVGLIINRNSVLMSFPKHCDMSGDTEHEIGELIKKILYLFCNEKIMHNDIESGDYNNFPINAYAYILNYFKKYGLYKQKYINYKYSYIGNIDWFKTINRSNKILQNNGIIFLPFIVRNHEDMDVYISYCMDLVLGDAAKYSDFIQIIYPYKYQYSSMVNMPNDKIINKLKTVKNMYFKDIEKQLIDNLIWYLEWKSSSNGYFRFVTTSFQNYWEKLIMSYLNTHNVSCVDDKLVVKKYTNQNLFIKDSDNVESEKILLMKNTRQFQIEYDHIKVDTSNKIIYLFDSKYYSDIKELNYKQMCYHYHLLSKYKDFKIIDGLILPTSKSYYSRIHIDRSDIDNVKIVEHYLNIKDIIKNHIVS